MKKSVSTTTRAVDRRSFMKSGLLAGGAATVGVGLLANKSSAQERGRLNPGDVAILRFLAAAELIEAAGAANQLEYDVVTMFVPRHQRK